MHVVTGGAYNGKAAWVEKYYQLEESSVHQWVHAYKKKKDLLPKDLVAYHGTIVLEGIEQWVYQWMQNKSMDTAREFGRQRITQWLAWEQLAEENRLVVICTDISKGIVPMDADLRKWRDLTGWFYQDLVKKAEQVHCIWYGIAQQLK